MQIQVNTARTIAGSEALARHVEAAVRSALERFGEQITRVEVHLSDENSHRNAGDDKKCVMEARPAGLPPVAVSTVAATLHQAIDAAAEKLERLLDGTFGRLGDPRGRTSDRAGRG